MLERLITRPEGEWVGADGREVDDALLANGR